MLLTPNLGGLTNSAVAARDLGGTLAVEIRHDLLNPWALRAKRAMDLWATAIGRALALPLIAALALPVWAESGGGPVLYKDRRMGKDGNLFSCIEFRTMVPDAEGILGRVLEEDAAAREEYHKLREDPRVTRVGPRPYLPRESLKIGGHPGGDPEGPAGDHRPLAGLRAGAGLLLGEGAHGRPATYATGRCGWTWCSWPAPWAAS